MNESGEIKKSKSVQVYLTKITLLLIIIFYYVNHYI